MIDQVDDRDQLVGHVSRGKALKTGANFRTAHVFVFDARGRLLLQRLASTRERHPGRFGSSVAAYLHAGETYEAAARRRIEEELCIAAPKLIRVGKIAMRDTDSTKFVTLFVTHAVAAPSICAPEQIEELTFRPLQWVDGLVREDPERFTPTFRELLSFFHHRQTDPP